jgi:hypothetical protein
MQVLLICLLTSSEWRLRNGSAVASAFAVYVVDILDYKDTNKYKTTKTLSGYDLEQC